MAELHRAILVGRAALLAAQRPPSADAAGAPAPAPDTAALTVSLATLQATYLDQVEQLKALLRLKHGGADRRRSRR